MKNSTTIKHDLRIEMKLNLSEYCVADAIHRNPKMSIKRIATNFHMTQENVDKIIRRLVLMNFLVLDPETNKVTASQAWIEGVKGKAKLPAVKKEYDDFHIVHKFRLKVLEIRPDYIFDGMNMKVSSLLISKFKTGFKMRFNRDGTDEEIISSFEKFIQLLPERWTEKPWDLKKLNMDYNLIIDEIKKKSNAKPKSQGRIIDAASNIQEARRLMRLNDKEE